MDKVIISKEEAVLLKCKLKGIKPLPVVAGLVEKDGKYLIARRLNGNPLVTGKWEFPGGKVEEEEEESAAIEREMREEFELNVKALEYVVNVVYEYPTRIIDLRLWHCRVEDENFSMDVTDHDKFKWASLEEIGEIELCPADKELYYKITHKN